MEIPELIAFFLKSSTHKLNSRLLANNEEDEKLNEDISEKSKELQTLADLIEQKAGEGNITSASVPREIAQEIQQAEVPESLMAKPQEQPPQEEEEAPASLMAR